MSTARDLNSAQAQEIEEQLFSVHRQQLPRQVPIPLPRPDFWDMVAALLSTLDVQIQNMVRKGATDMRLQNRACHGCFVEDVVCVKRRMA